MDDLINKYQLKLAAESVKQSEQLEKEAQYRSLWNRLKTPLNLKRHVRRLINTDYKDLLDEIGTIDDEIRTMPPNGWSGPANSAREILHNIRQCYRDRKHPLVVYWTFQLIDFIELSFKDLSRHLTALKNQLLGSFYDNEAKLSEEEQGYVTQRQEGSRELADTVKRRREEAIEAAKQKRIEQEEAAAQKAATSKAASKEYAKANKQIVVTAGYFGDMANMLWYNTTEAMPSGRSFTGSLFEYIFRGQLRKYTQAAKEAKSNAERIYKDLNRTYEILDDARASGDAGKYIETAEKFFNKLDDMKLKCTGLAKVFETLKQVAPTNPEQIELTRKQQQQQQQADQGVSTTAVPESVSPSPEGAPPEVISDAVDSAVKGADDADKNKTSNRIDNIIKNASKHYKQGDFDSAAALLCKASQISEDNGNIDYSIKLLTMAKRLLDG